MAGDDVELILAIVRGHPGGLTRKQLLAELRKGQPWIRPPQVEAAIATARERIKFVGDRLVLADTASAGQDVAGRPLRLIAFDLESVVRPTGAEPYAERRAYQMGAVRFGRDLNWVRENRKFNRYVSMPADAETLLENLQVRERYFANKQEPRIALEEFRRFVEGADIVIAYNGGDLDFPLLRQEYARAALPPLGFPASADGYYLALTLWPVPPRQHTLRQLRERLMLEVGEGRWHDALWDSHVLSILLGAGAKLVSGWDPNLQRLIRAASQSSSAWDVIFGLMPASPAPTEMTFGEVAEVLTDALASKPRIRTAGGEVTPEPATFKS